MPRAAAQIQFEVPISISQYFRKIAAPFLLIIKFYSSFMIFSDF